MSNITRSAKSGSNWSQDELFAYNIIVHEQSSVEFFGFEPSSSLDYIDPHMVNDSLNVLSDNISDQTYQLLRHLDLITNECCNRESMIDDFSKDILRVIGFEERGTVLCTRYSLPLKICGKESRSAQTDVCLLHGLTTVVLIVQENKTARRYKDPEPQLIAEAIAVFQYNNSLRFDAGVDELEAMTIPGITMVGTRPAYYKVPVTRALSGAVATGQYPPEPTHVHKCIVDPAILDEGEGMDNPQFRKVALQHFDAFKAVAKSLWLEFISR